MWLSWLMSVSRVSAEPYPGEGVGPAHSREVPLPLTRDEIGLTAVVILMVTDKV